MNHRAVVYALLSALLFGFSTPIAKGLLGTVDPAILAGLLYCGAGVGVAGLRRLGKKWVTENSGEEEPLRRHDVPWLLGAIVAGGVVAPILLMLGISRTAASSASLLQALEGVATALIAWSVFHEHIDRRIATGMACLVVGALILSWTGQPSLSSVVGPLAIVGACVAWGIDNNLTRKVSLADPLHIVEWKGIIAGPANLAIGFFLGNALPAIPTIAFATFLGFVCYGISLSLFVYALRHLGAARAGAYFSTAPFFGALGAVALLGEPVTLQLLCAGLVMAVGVWLHLTEDHHHEHTHEVLEHAHAHIHDAHHQHVHTANDPIGEPHTHAHRHEPLRHSHAHVPDVHHGHRH
jgi:drug/metabolite transporter (DMT)-like permease